MYVRCINATGATGKAERGRGKLKNGGDQPYTQKRGKVAGNI